MQGIKLISKEIVQRNLQFKDLIPLMRNALKEFSCGGPAQPVRTTIWTTQERRHYMMPSYSGELNVFATKMLSVYPDCADRGLPVRNSYLLLFNNDDGTLQCVMESEPISHMRTAAATVAATQAIVKKDSLILGVIGSGNQAINHILAFNEIYKLQKVLVWSRNEENVRKLCERLLLHGISIYPCADAKEAASEADVVVTATSSKEAVIEGSWLKSGCHVNVIGAIHPNWREVDDDCMNDAVVYTDSIKLAQQESGDIILSKAPIYAEVGEIISGTKAPKSRRLTVFKSMGLAIEDAYSADLIWNSIQQQEQ